MAFSLVCMHGGQQQIWSSKQLPRIKECVSENDLVREIRIRDLIGAIQAGATVEDIEKYLEWLREQHSSLLAMRINETINGIPSIFYVVETFNENMIRTWVKYGGDVNAVWDKTSLPLLAFAILFGANTSSKKATSTLTALLSLGACPNAIPQALYAPFNYDIPPEGSSLKLLFDRSDSNKKWCDQLQFELSRALNITQRYHLFESSKKMPLSTRQIGVAERNGALPLLGIEYGVIGQTLATQLLKECLLSHLALSEEKPLILMFAGPSGHGKNKVATQLGELMEMEMVHIDCTNHQNHDTFFGPFKPYWGWKEGSALNNFLAANGRQKCVVFLDEFEKTTGEVHNGLLIPFENGIYTDRRNHKPVDIKRYIWILATNAFDDTILEFCKKSRTQLSESNNLRDQQNLLEDLQNRLRDRCKDKFGAALTSRISRIIPFLTFTREEQAVVAHTELMDLEATLGKPIIAAQRGAKGNIVGNIQMNIVGQYKVCAAIAKRSYDPALGARSIFSGVNNLVKDPIMKQYMQYDTDISNEKAETIARVGVISGGKIEVWLKNKANTKALQAAQAVEVEEVE
ncbi:P-loop containing nucleoside triphosphate hydrolase protein [Xylariaceae sp. FL0255]|nr:P-loop containing nucleoside triphosphate hydrolase protein [Xylariaceae sp. FL0255]